MPIEPKTETLPAKAYILGIDVGGQGVKAELFEVLGGKLSDNARWSYAEAPERGVDEHAAQVARIIAEGQKEASQLKGSLAGIGVASPGRFDETGRIKPGTNAHLGKKTTDFDNVHLQEKYAEALRARDDTRQLDVPLFVNNDGNAMLAGMIAGIMSGNQETMLRDHTGAEITRFSLPNHRIGLFGIGTGVGHAIADVDRKGNITFVTDGHASKLMIPVDEQDWPTVEKLAQQLARLPKPIHIVYDADKRQVMSEYLFCDPAICALAGVENGIDIDPAKNEQHKAALEFAGKYMARTIAGIKNKTVRDHNPANGWTERDHDEAARTDMYLIGGGMGRGEKTGPALIAAAAAELRIHGVNDIALVHVPGKNPAMYQAALLVPPSEYRAQVRKAGV